ncbi:MAG: alpha/beta hydrolase [bacterium]|nr:alpha/beta hydrolase [bacterium]
MKAFLIPGNGEDLRSRDYQAVLDMYKQLGYEPKFVSIDWKYKTIDDWVEQAKKKIPASDIKNSLLSGFSFGSMIALAIAAEVNPKRLLLFSLSPYFKEDMPLPPSYEKWAGKRKIENFKHISFDKLAAQIDCPTMLFVGSKEVSKYADTNHRSSEAKKRIKDSKLVVVKDVGHDAADPKYIEAIKIAL